MKLYVLTAVSRPHNLEAMRRSLLAAQVPGVEIHWITDDDPTPEVGGNSKKNRCIDRAMAREPGWVYVLDDDNTMRPDLPSCLLRAVRDHPGAVLLAFRQLDRSGRPRAETWSPCLQEGRIDAGQVVVHTSAIKHHRWPGTLYSADYWWIREIVEDGAEIVFREEACTTYNSLAVPTRILVGIPTLTRGMGRYAEARDWLLPSDHMYVVDNGDQRIDMPFAEVYRPGRNLGVPVSWNLIRRRAFERQEFEACLILQDDVSWDGTRMEAARRLLRDQRDSDLLLSCHQFSVQVHRPGLPDFDERYFPCWCEDDDYALELTRLGLTYRRFRELDPCPGSIMEGTPRAIRWDEGLTRLAQKWGTTTFRVNDADAPHYMTNAAFVEM